MVLFRHVLAASAKEFQPTPASSPLYRWMSLFATLSSVYYIVALASDRYTRRFIVSLDLLVPIAIGCC